MTTIKRDFLGELEWLEFGTRLYIDKSFAQQNGALKPSTGEIERLAVSFQDQPINKTKQQKLLKKLLTDLQGKYEQLYISTADGDYFNAEGQSNNIRDRFYFREVMKGNTVVSSMIINKSTKRPVIAVATPIWDGERIIGLFGATILLFPTLKDFKKISLIINGNHPGDQKKKSCKSARITAEALHTLVA